MGNRKHPSIVVDDVSYFNYDLLKNVCFWTQFTFSPGSYRKKVIFESSYTINP